MSEFDEVFEYFKGWKFGLEKEYLEKQKKIEELNRELDKSPVHDLQEKLSKKKDDLDYWKSELLLLKKIRDNYNNYTNEKESLTDETLIMLSCHKDEGYSFSFIDGIEYDIRTAQREIKRRQPEVNQINETLQATLKKHRSSESIKNEKEKLYYQLSKCEDFLGVLGLTCDYFRRAKGKPDREKTLKGSAFYSKALTMYEDSKQPKGECYDLEGLGELNSLLKKYIKEIESAQRSRASSARVTAPTARVGGRPRESSRRLRGSSSAADSRSPQR